MEIEYSSFRDRDGFVATSNDKLLRIVQPTYAAHYTRLMKSGLYEELVQRKLMVYHREMESSSFSGQAWKILEPEKIHFISYPYEWSFSQLKDAALLTLEILVCSLEKGLILKDASAFNVQFHKGRPIFIDTLSFAEYKEGEPWMAFEQFCRHFLAPLVLMQKIDLSMNRLLAENLDGIPLSLASKLLPASSWLSFGTITHIHLHAKQIDGQSQAKYQTPMRQISKSHLLGFVEHLRDFVQGLDVRSVGTNWTTYYGNCHYQESDFAAKEVSLRKALDQLRPAMVWDFGANEGYFSKISAQEYKSSVVAVDSDPVVIDALYNKLKTSSTSLLPMIINLCSPTPAIGWNNQERKSFLGRGPCDLGIAFALIHHLRISGGIPFSRMSDFFAKSCRNLLIEFVAEADPKSREIQGPFYQSLPDYSLEAFILEFKKNFSVEFQQILPVSGRTIFLLKNLNLLT